MAAVSQAVQRKDGEVDGEELQRSLTRSAFTGSSGCSSGRSPAQQGPGGLPQHVWQASLHRPLAASPEHSAPEPPGSPPAPEPPSQPQPCEVSPQRQVTHAGFGHGCHFDCGQQYKSHPV